MSELAQVIHGNCFEVLPTLAPDSVDFVLTSPPYDSMRDYNGFPPIDRVRLGRELHRVCRDGAVCAVVIQDETRAFAKSLTSFRWAVEWVDQCGWRLFETCVYQRMGVPGNHWRSRFRVDHEYVHLFLKGARPAYFDKSHLFVPCRGAGKFRPVVRRRRKHGRVTADHNNGWTCPETKCRGTVWPYMWPYMKSCGERNPLKWKHPATFPQKLAADLIRCFSPSGGLVLDCFAGSGSTLVEATKWGRRSIGVELSVDYCGIIRQRLDSEISVDIFAAGEGIPPPPIE